MTQITPEIWLGNSKDAGHWAPLKKAGITAILNVAMNLPPELSWKQGLVCCHIPLIDGPGNHPAMFMAALVALRALVGSSHKVLVHCHGGISRSPAVVAGYLVQTKFCRSLSSAEELLKKFRPGIEIDSALKVGMEECLVKGLVH